MSGTGGGTTSTTSHSKFEDETGLSLQGRHGRSERHNNDISMWQYDRDRSRLFFNIHENEKERRERERRRSKGVGGALIERTPWTATSSGRISERREGRCRGDRQHRPNDRINPWPSALTITTSTRPSATSATISTTRIIRKLTNSSCRNPIPTFDAHLWDSMTDYVLLYCLLKE